MTKSNDKKVPALRFKGFTDDWEQRKLGDFGNVAMNKRIFKNQTSDSGEIPFYKIGTFGKKANSFISKKLFEQYKAKYPYPKIGDILISASGSIGRTVVYKGEDAYFQDSNIVWLNHDKQLTNSFLKQFYLIVKWKGLEGSTIKRLYNKDILSTVINVPSVQEQSKIGDIFSMLDNLITLQQRKLEELNLLNQGMLQQMFANKDIPKIRFKEFKSIWEHRKLDSLAEFSKGKGYSKKDLITKGNPIVLYGQLYTNYQPIIKKIDTFAKTNKESVISRGREVIVPASGETADDISRASVVNKAGIIIGGDLNIIRPYSIISPIFLAFTLSNGTQRKELSKYAQGKSVVHLHNADLKNVNVFFPTMKEQSKINSILSKLNELNLLSKNKLAILQEIKNALLQILFV